VIEPNVWFKYRCRLTTPWIIRYSADGKKKDEAKGKEEEEEGEEEASAISCKWESYIHP
jgi:hypothetical protein